MTDIVARLHHNIARVKSLLDLAPLLDDAAREIDKLRADQPVRLTAAEREAVEWCVEMAVLHATDCDSEVKAMRGLLERTK